MFRSTDGGDHMRRLISKFVNHEGGNFAVILGLVLVPVMATIGAAVDYSQLYSTKSKMQAAADTAVLAAARDARTVNEFTDMSDAYLSANLPGIDLEIESKTGPRSVELTIVNRYQTSFLGIVGMPEVPITINTELAIEKFGRGGIHTGTQDEAPDASQDREYRKHLKDARRKLLQMANQLPPRDRERVRRKIDAAYKSLMSNASSPNANLPVHIMR